MQNLPVDHVRRVNGETQRRPTCGVRVGRLESARPALAARLRRYLAAAAGYCVPLALEAGHCIVDKRETGNGGYTHPAAQQEAVRTGHRQ
jgi:hypothetical protein